MMVTDNFFPEMSLFVQETLDENKPSSKRFTDIFNATINLIELSLEVFLVVTIRTYEDKFNSEDKAVIKKTKLIKETLRDKFAAPSLGSLAALAKSCFHIVDESAPPSLKLMRDKLDEPILLGAIASLISDLTKMYQILEDQQDNQPQIVNRASTKKVLLQIINEFVAFRNDSAHLVTIGKIIEDNQNILRINIDTWSDAFKYLLQELKPFLAHTYRHKSISNIYSENGFKMISIKNIDFLSGTLSESTEKFKLEDWYEDQWTEKSQIVIKDKKKEIEIDLFPFLLLREGKLFFYKKTRASGYQYFSIIDDHTFTSKTKKKFNRSLFKTSTTANSQALFWTEVLPHVNPINDIKANIPSQGSTQFVGRKKQISKIKEEIIEIPNQNGILYGPGGVGKTALLIELSQQLYIESNKANVLYDNIVWVSAKSNFYYWEQNATVTNPQQFESLDNILQILLRFFDYEDVDEYNIDELKELVFELLEENKVLLVLDNFETVTKVETEKIISFFGSEVKKHLKRLPSNFKVILTSRELIPSGFYQIKLEGLELRESKVLMESIYTRYKDSHSPLTPEQYKLIHEATFGIPIVIKHCLGQIFEFHVPLSEIFNRLSEESNEVIKFSYSEILSHLRKDDCYLKILILLEVLNEPISARQMALILEINNSDINNHLPILLNFQCIEKLNVGIEEKFRVSHQIGLLAKGLIKDNLELTNGIRLNIANNLTLEKKMDYAVEELEIIEIFNGYIEVRDFTYAEYFLKGEINKRPSSHLLRYHYALFLRDRRKEIKQSIELLETLDREIKKSGNRDANILLALISTYTLLEFPNYQKANELCLDLLKLFANVNTKLFTGEFFINWSNALKNKREPDPIEDIKRKNKIKELAKKGIQLIEETGAAKDKHQSQYFISMAYFNLWDTAKAKEFVLKAIEQTQKDIVSLRKYEKFLSIIERF
jgi:GTPase SAR1 family protein